MKTFILVLISFFSLNVFAEKRVNVCGVLSYEETFEHGSDEKRYVINYSYAWSDWQGEWETSYRFELIYLERGQLRYLKSLMNKASNGGIVNVCVEGDFGGDFSWSGFDAGGTRLYSGRIVDFEEIEFSYESY